MRIKVFIILCLILLCGCQKNKMECTYKSDDEQMESYTRITLIYNDKLIKTEKLYAVYQFKDEESATNNYNKIEKVLERDETVKLEQSDDCIIAKGEKDVTDMQYDKDTKIAYYEQLGYTCK